MRYPYDSGMLANGLPNPRRAASVRWWDTVFDFETLRPVHARGTDDADGRAEGADLDANRARMRDVLAG